MAQLNHDLVALGYVDSADVDSAWDEFNWATKAGVEKLQNHLGVDQTGELSSGRCGVPADRRAGDHAAGQPRRTRDRAGAVTRVRRRGR